MFVPKTPLDDQLHTHRDATFREVGAFGREVGWDIDFRQLDSGAPRIGARMLVGSHITVVGFRFGRAYHQRGFAPRDALNFGIPFEGSLDWHRNQVEVPQVLCFNGDSGFDAVSGAGFTGVTLSVPKNWLHETAAAFGMPVPDQVFDRRAGFAFMPSEATRKLTGQLRAVLTSGPRRFDTDWESDTTLELIAAALGDSKCNDTSTLNKRARAIKLALDFTDAHRGEAIRVRDICRETGVPWRTLDRAFRERFGVGPKAYLMRGRLCGARESLGGGPHDQRIVDVANAWGFWHMGQFARDYKRLFGELPSQTLDRGHT